MRVVVLTSSKQGTAAHHLPALLKSPHIEVVLVVLNEGRIGNKARHYKRKLRKILKIGVLGALNGIRMRRWYRASGGAAAPSLDLICRNHAIPFHTTPTINCPETRELFQEARADVGISLGNGYIAESVFSIPTEGMINIHHEVLPQYQNAQSVVWQLYNGSRSTGYTIHRINKRIDGGEILYQEQVPIVFRPTLAETVSRTMAALLDASATGLVKTLEHLPELLRGAAPQGHGTTYTTPTFRQYLRVQRNFKRLAKGA